MPAKPAMGPVGRGRGVRGEECYPPGVGGQREAGAGLSPRREELFTHGGWGPGALGIRPGREVQELGCWALRGPRGRSSWVVGRPVLTHREVLG